MDLLKDLSFACSDLSRSLFGVIVIVLVDDVEHRRIIWTVSAFLVKKAFRSPQ